MDSKDPSQIFLEHNSLKGNRGWDREVHDANSIIEVPLIAGKRDLQSTFYEFGNGLRLLPESTEHISDSCDFDNMQADSLSLSADGNTIAVGYRLHDGYRYYYITAVVEVYTYNDSTGRWSLKGSPIIDAGSVVSLSADGNRLATGEWQGSGFLFGEHTYTGGETVHIYNFESLPDTWTETGIIQNEYDGEKSDAYFGYSISLSDDGKILAVGHPGKFFGGIYYVCDDDPDFFATGMIHVYIDQGEGNWEELGQPIDGEESAFTFYGPRLELSSNGKVIAVASTNLNYVRIYRFEETTSSWLQMGLTIVGTVSPSSLLLSTDGMRAVIGFGEEQRMIAFDGNDWISIEIGSESVVFEETGTIIRSVTTDGAEVSFRTSGRRVAVSADGTTIATARSESVHIFSTSAPPTTLPTMTPTVRATKGNGSKRSKKNKSSKTKSGKKSYKTKSGKKSYKEKDAKGSNSSKNPKSKDKKSSKYKKSSKMSKVKGKKDDKASKTRKV